MEDILILSDELNQGWGYPPRDDTFAVIGPRGCPRCPGASAVWWALAIDNFTEDMLTEGLPSA